VIKHLGSRGDEGLEALARHVREPRPVKPPSFLVALQEIAALEQKSDKGILSSLQKSTDPQVRWYAGVAHFSFRRDLSSYPLALELLNADHDPRLKRTFLLRLRQQNAPIFDQLAASLESLAHDDVKEMVQQVAARGDPRSRTAPGSLLPPRDALPPTGSAPQEEKS